MIRLTCISVALVGAAMTALLVGAIAGIAGP